MHVLSQDAVRQQAMRTVARRTAPPTPKQISKPQRVLGPWLKSHPSATGGGLCHSCAKLFFSVLLVHKI